MLKTYQLKTYLIKSTFFYFYCLQCSCGKVMFLHVSAILFTELSGRHFPWAHTPLPRHTHPGQKPPWAHTPDTHTPSHTPRQTPTWAHTTLEPQHPGHTPVWAQTPPWADTHTPDRHPRADTPPFQ